MEEEKKKKKKQNQSKAKRNRNEMEQHNYYATLLDYNAKCGKSKHIVHVFSHVFVRIVNIDHCYRFQYQNSEGNSRVHTSYFVDHFKKS